MNIMKTLTTILLALLIGSPGHTGCIEQENLPAPSSLQALAPGDIIPLETKVCIRSAGIYKLTHGASLLTTRCYGSISVSFQLPDSTSQTNSCNSPSGRTSQTNYISGVNEVFYSIQSGSYAEISLQ